MSKPIQPFPWYGSKALKTNLVIPNLPKTDHYCEPFGGSGAILLNKERSDFEVFNDINERVMNFFKALKDSPEELIEKLQSTPYHEGFFQEAEKIMNDENSTVVDRAWAFFIRATCSYNSRPDGTFAYATKEIRRNRPQTVSRFDYKINNLDDVVDRLRSVQFMNRDALELIEMFDNENMVFYLDPPYPHGVRNGSGYKHEMSNENHKELLEVLLNVDGYVCLSSFSNPLYEELLSEWMTVDGKEYKTPASNDQRTCTERIYMNYNIDEISEQKQSTLSV